VTIEVDEAGKARAEHHHPCRPRAARLPSGRLARQVRPFCESADFEVQERAWTTHTMLARLQEAARGGGDGGAAAELLGALREALAPEIKPVAPHAQRKVKTPKVLLEWDAAELGEDDIEEVEDEEESRAAKGAQASPPGAAASPADSTPDAAATPRRPPPQSPFYLSESAAGASGADSAAVEAPPCQRRSSNASADEQPLEPESDGPSREASLSGGGAATGVLQPHEWQDDAEAEVNLDEDEPSETEDAEADGPSAGTPLASAAGGPSYGSSRPGAANPALIDF
jgi:hypothetical protein